MADKVQEPIDTVVEQAEDDAPVVVTLGDEPEDDDIGVPNDAPTWAKKLRETAEERRKRLRELEGEVKALKAKAAPVEDEPLGDKPTLLDPDIDGDEDVFEQRLLAWHETKRKTEGRKEAQRKQQEEQESTWQAKLTGYSEGKKRLRVPDFEDAEDVVLTVFDQTQHGIMVHGAKDAAVLAYAIGKNPAKAKELAAIKDPIAFAFAISKLEETVKVTSRTPATKPEGTITSNARGSSSIDNHLEKLRAEAERTGDFSKVMAYKRQLKNK